MDSNRRHRPPDPPFDRESVRDILKLPFPKDYPKETASEKEARIARFTEISQRFTARGPPAVFEIWVTKLVASGVLPVLAPSARCSPTCDADVYFTAAQYYWIHTKGTPDKALEFLRTSQEVRHFYGFVERRRPSGQTPGPGSNLPSGNSNLYARNHPGPNRFPSSQHPTDSSGMKRKAHDRSDRHPEHNTWKHHKQNWNPGNGRGPGSESASRYRQYDDRRPRQQPHSTHYPGNKKFGAKAPRCRDIEPGAGYQTRFRDEKAPKPTVSDWSWNSHANANASACPVVDGTNKLKLAQTHATCREPRPTPPSLLTTDLRAQAQEPVQPPLPDPMAADPSSDSPDSETTVVEPAMDVAQDSTMSSDTVALTPDLQMDIAPRKLEASIKEELPPMVLWDPSDDSGLPGGEAKLASIPAEAKAQKQEPPGETTMVSEPCPNLIPLTRYPPIWAQTRQEVCETFEWFRSYQGGVYFSNDIAKGYLLSAFGAKRDKFEHKGRLIISHGGGRAESLHTENGKHLLKEAEDQQANDKSVRALLKNYREQRPLALVIDDRYPLFPYSLASKDATYAILGFYMIVHTWAEYQDANTEQGRIVKYKFAFQWCEGQGEPWWCSADGVPTSFEDVDEFATAPEKLEEHNMDADIELDSVSMQCEECKEESPHVYKLARVCLNPSCNMFWKDVATGASLPEQLEYQEDFLKLQKPCYLPIGYESLKPRLVTERTDGITTSAAFTRGYHCPKCGRLSCRTEWRFWKCNTIGCESSYRLPSRIHAANEFCYQPIAGAPKFQSEWIEKDCGIVRKRLRTFSIGKSGAVGQVQTIVLPKGRGYLHHVRSNAPFSKDEVNGIFKKYQEEANEGTLNFRRWPLRAHKCRGALLTNYFSHNTGEPYHYVGGTENTVPFDQAPVSVLNARALIERRIIEALDKKMEFNEVLTAAYMEKQKMAFHSDDEKGLGSVVAGLSLGSPALMHFRLQRKYSGTHKGILASFILRHGDVLVMDGSGVQKYYEHTVVPTNFRIAATARFISPGQEHMQVKTECKMDSEPAEILLS